MSVTFELLSPFLYLNQSLLLGCELIGLKGRLWNRYPGHVRL